MESRLAELTLMHHRITEGGSRLENRSDDARSHFIPRIDRQRPFSLTRPPRYRRVVEASKSLRLDPPKPDARLSRLPADSYM